MRRLLALPAAASTATARLAMLATMCVSLHAPAAVAGWTISGAPQMSVARYRHTATLLADGRLLVTGGDTGNNSLTRTAEILDLPAGATSWQPVGNMQTARYRHAAVLLRNGKVFVSGGQDEYTTEIFNPATGTFSPGPNMATSRAHHTATLLRDGRVLICGGYDYSSASLSSVDIYNPSTNTITAAAPMNSAHSFHGAAMLADGRVLVVGGEPTGNAAEIYNPTLNTWTSIAAPSGQFDAPSLTVMLDGRALVVWLGNGAILDATATTWTPAAPPHGREHQTTTLLPSGAVLLYGGEASSPASDTADLYTPGVGWSSFPIGNNPESHAATLLPSGQIVLTGRNDTGGSLVAFPTPTVNIVTPPDFGASAKGAGAVPQRFLSEHLTPLPTGRVLGFGSVATAEFDPATETWTTVTPPVDCDRYRAAMTLLPDGRVMAAGHSYGRPDCYPAIYDPFTQSWSDAPQLPNRRYYPEASLLTDGRLLVTGGIPVNSGYPPSPYSDAKIADIFDYRTNTWTPTGSLHVDRNSHSSTLLADGRVLIAGGQPSEASPQCEIYDPATGVFTVVASMNTGRFFHGAALLPGGDVLVIGGLNADGFTNTVERYDVARNKWSVEPSLSAVRNGAGVVSLMDGRVLVAGGGSTAATQTTSEIYSPVTRTWIPGPSGFAALTSSSTGTLMPDGRALFIDGWTGTTVIIDPLASTAPRATIAAGGAATYSAQVGAPLCAAPYKSCDSGDLLVSRANIGGQAEPNQPNTIASGCVDGPLGSFHVDESVDRIVVQTVDGTAMAPGKTVRVDVTVWAYFSYTSDTLEIFAASDAANPQWTPLTSIVPGAAGINVLSTTFTLPAGGARQAVRARFRYSDSPAPSGCGAAPYDDHDDLVFAVGTGEAIPSFGYGSPLTLSGTKLLGATAGSSGAHNDSSSQPPLFELRSIDSGKTFVLAPDDGAPFSTGTAPVVFSSLPAGLDVGPHLLTAISSGVRSNTIMVGVKCGVGIRTQPAGVTAPIGGTATFSVVADGARGYQWQKDATASGAWANIAGATGRTYTASAISGADAGARFRVLIGGNCATVASNAATLSVADAVPPAVSVVSPSGGEYWLLSNASEAAHTQVVTWSMSDNVRVCKVDVRLLYSNDGGVSYAGAPNGGGLPATFGSGGTCAYPGESTTSLTYTIPASFPSGVAGSLYKIEVKVTDQAGLITTVTSANPFYIVQPNPDSVKTLIVWNRARMIARQSITTNEADQIAGKLQELANHPRVQGLVVDLSGVTSITSLYSTWDADSANATKANAVLFGAGGVHEYLLTNLLSAYSGVKYLVIVGDDRIVPMARLADGTVLLPESTYANNVDLSSTATTVGQALASGKYLSDDPLAVLDPVSTSALSGALYVPDLGVGRLVETPQEIITTIATYISQDGVLDISPAGVTNKVLVTGYDFLTNVAVQMRKRWKSMLGDASGDASTAPVDGSLVGGTWGLGSVSQRATALRTKISGNGGSRFGVMAIAGHATHYEEGVPGTNPFDIQGLSTADIYGTDACSTPTLGALQLAGSVIYAVGCHGGLSVPGSCRTDANHSLDLPQTMLRRGAVAYVANSGYGWGLKYGIGYGGRLVEIFTEQLTGSSTVAVGDAVKAAKQRYFLEAPRYDAYDEKSLMQWTLYGLPMYAVKTGIVAGSNAPTTQSSVLSPQSSEATLGGVKVRRTQRMLNARSSELSASALPASLTQLNLSFDFTAAGVYEKHDSQGNVLAAGNGCPDANGCYYTLNGLVDRGTGSGDVPIQPYLIYDSRLSGTSQHGVLWKGGTYDEESNFKPVIAELVSNGGDGSNHGAAPRTMMIRPTAPRVVPGVDAPGCRTSDLELNTLTITAGEAAKPNAGDLTYSIARRYRNIDLEAYYFNDRTTPANNCDRSGPALGAGPFAGNYHQVTNGPSSSTIAWSVPATDPAGVWRVVVVYNPNTVTSGRGTWTPLELTTTGNGTYTGNVTVSGTTRLTYVIQAVDNRGNVTWLDYVSAQLPASGVPLGVPKAVDAGIGPLQPPSNVVATAATTTSVAITWAAADGAATYDIYRSASGTSYVKLGSTAALTYTDNTASASTAYLYAIKSVDSSNASSASYSAPDLATTVIFTDPTLTAGVTPIKAAHITELRTAVNAVRTLAGLAAFSFTDPTITPAVTKAKAAHVTELRTAVDAARAVLGLIGAAYTNSVSSGAPIRAADINDARSAVR